MISQNNSALYRASRIPAVDPLMGTDGLEHTLQIHPAILISIAGFCYSRDIDKDWELRIVNIWNILYYLGACGSVVVKAVCC
jgi:hypothetical protein